MARELRPLPQEDDPPPPFHVLPQHIEKLSRELRAHAGNVSPEEARFLVDLYYSVQKFRISGGNQTRALTASGEPPVIVAWSQDAFATIESEIRLALDKFTQNRPETQWARSIVGIGPVIAAGLAVHTHIEHCPTAGHLWSFGGLNPTAVWGKGQKRPWNASFKLVLWKLGESFTKVQNNKSDVYGKMYAARREYEDRKNLAGDYADQANVSLTTKKIGKDTEAYKYYSQGQLPPARILLRCQRFAVKIFLSHWHQVVYFLEYGQLAPVPYVQAHLGHVHLNPIPNVELVPGFAEALKAANRVA